jgi:hypothetical protein
MLNGRAVGSWNRGRALWVAVSVLVAQGPLHGQDVVAELALDAPQQGEFLLHGTLPLPPEILSTEHAWCSLAYAYGRTGDPFFLHRATNLLGGPLWEHLHEGGRTGSSPERRCSPWCSPSREADPIWGMTGPCCETPSTRPLNSDDKNVGRLGPHRGPI